MTCIYKNFLLKKCFPHWPNAEMHVNSWTQHSFRRVSLSDVPNQGQICRSKVWVWQRVSTGGNEMSDWRSECRREVQRQKNPPKNPKNLLRGKINTQTTKQSTVHNNPGVISWSCRENFAPTAQHSEMKLFNVCKKKKKKINGCCCSLQYLRSLPPSSGLLRPVERTHYTPA